MDTVTGPSDDLITRFVEAIRNSCLPARRACWIVGYETWVVAEWMKVAQAVNQEFRTPDTPYEEQCVAFYRRVMRAEVEVEQELISIIRNAGSEGDWKASQFLLSTRFREDWAAASSVKIADFSRLDPTKMSEEELKAFIADKTRS